MKFLVIASVLLANILVASCGWHHIMYYEDDDEASVPTDHDDETSVPVDHDEVNVEWGIDYDDSNEEPTKPTPKPTPQPTPKPTLPPLYETGGADVQPNFGPNSPKPKLEVIIKKFGWTMEDIKPVEDLNKKSPTGCDGWWTLLIKIVTKGKPKPEVDRITKIVIDIVHKNDKKIRESAQRGKWTVIIEILTNECKKQNIPIDWKLVFTESIWTQIIYKWSVMKVEDAKKTTIIDWLVIPANVL